MISIIKNPKEISLIESPLIIGINNTDTTNWVRLDLTLYRGDIGMIGSTDVVTYTGIEFDVYDNNGNSYINISDRLLRYMGRDIEPFWIQYDIYDFDGTIDYNVVCLITKGYNGFINKYEVNYGYDIDEMDARFFCNIPDVTYVDSEMTYTFPVYIGRTSNNRNLKTNIGDFDLDTDYGLTLNSNDSSLQIGYITIGKDNPLFSIIWESGNTLKYNIDTLITSNPDLKDMKIDCSNNACKIKFLNSYGSYSEIPSLLNKVSQTFEKKSFNNQINKWDINDRSRVSEIYMNNGSEFIDVSTGWIDESSNIIIDELLLSKKIFLSYNDNIYPVIIINTKKENINRRFKNEIGYSFRFRISQKIINKIY
jgi:hypothetical protein